MPRERFDPYKPKTHETSKTARRNYLKRLGINAGPSPSQQRAAQARIEASQRAEDLREKEKKAKRAKERRLEKERKEKEARLLLVEQGKLKPEDLLPKVRASQPRLTFFLGGAKAKQPANDEKAAQEEEECLNSETETSGTESEDETDETEADEEAEVEYQPPVSREDLEAFLQSIASTSSPSRPEEIKTPETLRRMDLPKQLSPAPAGLTNISEHPKSTQDAVDVQLSSEALFSFDEELEIFEDVTAQQDVSLQRSSGPSRKRKADELEEEDPSLMQSNRPVFSQMSPSKVNIRAKEKPNPEEKAFENGAEPSPDLLAGLCTQDFADDLEVENSDKENVGPSLPLPKENSQVLKKMSQSDRSASKSFVASLRDVGSSSVKKGPSRDSETDYGDLEVSEDELGIDDFAPDDPTWLNEAVLNDLPPTPSKSRVAKNIFTPSKNVVASASKDSQKNRLPESQDVFNTSFSGFEDLDIDQLIKSGQKADDSPSRPKKRRRIPWMDSTQPSESPRVRSLRSATASGSKSSPSSSKAKETGDAGWDALEAMACTFDEDF